MTDIWTPSDDVLLADPIAAAKVANPHSSPNLSEAGIVLPDSDGDDEANEELACLILAEMDGDEASEEVESGEVDDDQEILDTHDTQPVGDEI